MLVIDEAAANAIKFFEMQSSAFYLGTVHESQWGRASGGKL
jgi:hypothetical protein